MPQSESDFDSADFARLLHTNKYRLVAKKGEGTFSEVLKAQSLATGEHFAIKCMKSSFKNLEQVNSLREIQALRRLNPHPNIIDLEEVLYDKSSGRLALVFELMDQNIYELIRGRKQPLKPATVKLLMYQLFKAVAHMHKHGIFHRDIKPENVLILGDHYLKVADYGSCRGIYTQAPYTEYISTRWYRAPECLLTSGYYDYKMDIWGIGCVMFEIISLFPLFPGSNELDQVEKIHLILGTPGPEMLEQLRQHSSHIKNFNFPPKAGSGIQRLVPHASPEAVDLMEKLLAYNPEHRLTARQALRHPYFRELREAEKRERDRVRTASPKIGRALQSRDAAAAAAAAASGGAGNGEDDKDDAASSSSAAASAAPSPAPPADLHTLQPVAAAAAGGGGGASSGKDGGAGKKKALGGKSGSNDGMVPSKKFPSIMPAQTNPGGMPASNHHFQQQQQQQHGGGAGGSGLTLPSAFDKGAHGAHSSSATSSPSLPAAATAAGSIAMPHIHAGHHASHGHVHGKQIAVQPNLGGTADSLPSTDGSPSHAAGRRQPKGSKAHKAAAALHAQLLLEKQTAAAAAAAAASADHAGDDMSEAGLDGSVAGDGVDGNADDGDEAAMRERAALKHKEKAKELSLLKQTAAAAALAGSTAGATAASASHTRKTLHKNSSQLHLLAAQQPHAYQQYSAAAVSGAHKQGGKAGKHAPVPNALLPSLAGGGRASAAGYDAAVAALHAAHASRASAAPAHGHAHGHGQGHGHAHGAATLAHLKSSSSLAMLQQEQGQGQGQWHGASNGPSPSNDDYADAYDDEQPNDSNAASALDMLQQQAALLHKKKQAAAAIGSASRKPKKGSAAATAAAYGQSPAAGSPHGTAENLSLSGHTAPISMHNSGSSTQLRSGKSSGKKSKAAAAALSMALHALDVAPQPHDGKQRK